MKRILTIVFVLFTRLVAKGQMYDSQWVLGSYQSVLDFRVANVVSVYTIPTAEDFIFTSASICDEAGNLLYYTNGIGICGVSDTILNGTGLNPCLYTEEDSLNGLNIQQAALFIPKPGSTRYYYLFHFSNDTANNTRPGTIYYSLVDKEGNSGRGEHAVC